MLETRLSACFEGGDARRDERLRGRRERETIDDDARERVPDDVDPLPKRPSREQHGIARRAKPLEQRRAGQIALHLDGEGEALAQQRVDLTQPRVRGEQDEGAPARAVEDLLDQGRRAAREVDRLGIELRRRDEEPGLPRVVER